MKGYTDFAMGFLGAEAVATKPIGSMKYMDWQKVQEIVDEHPNSVIYAGLMEDWGYTSGLIYAKGKYYNGYVYGSSTWATPIVDVDGEEIECWTYKQTEEGSGKPTWWGKGQKLLSEWDYEDECDDDDEEEEDEEDVDNTLNEIIEKIKAVTDDKLYEREDAWFRAGIDEGLERAIKIIMEYLND